MTMMGRSRIARRNLLAPLALAVVATLPLTACSGDSSTGPENVEISGTWQFTFGTMSGSLLGVVVNCNSDPFDFQITQTDVTFSGLQVGESELTCVAQGQVLSSGPVNSETIVDGEVDGSTVTFRFGSLQGLHTATVTGNAMSGTAEWTVTNEGLTLSLSGSFTAVRT